MNTRALTLAMSLLGTAAVSVALPGMSGCNPLDCDVGPSTIVPFELGVTVDLHAISQTWKFDYEYVAVGAEGTVVAWGDSGVRVSTIGTADLRAVETSTDSWWVVGDAGTVAVSGDQGQTWIPVAVPTTADLHAILRLGDQLMVVGDDVLLVQAADGTWIDPGAPSGSWGQLRALYRHSTGRFYAVGLGGVIWSTSDPGGEWVAESSGTQADLFALGASFGAENTVTVVGAAGTYLVGESGEWKRIDTGEDVDFLAYDSQLLGADGTLFDVDPHGKLSRGDTFPGARAMTSGVVVGDDGAAFIIIYDECYGRPFIVDGRSQTASLQWCDVATSLDRLRGTGRASIAQGWAKAGLYEHASVASFARFALELLALGAPPRLLRDVQAAIADELRHAEVCFELARRFAGVGVGPGPMPIAANAFARVGDPIATAIALFDEACVEESVAACMAAEAAARSEDPEVRHVLEGIAVDERRHAVAGWAALRWMLDTYGDQIREPLRAQLARLRPSNRVLEQLVCPLARAMLEVSP